MRICVLIFLFCVGFVSCSDKDRVPGDVLAKEKMENVLWDILQADEFLRDYVLSKDSTLNDTLESIRMYEKVFQLHKTSREEFARSFDYYRVHPPLMKQLLDSLNARSQQAPEVSTPRKLERVDSSALRKLRNVVQ